MAFIFFICTLDADRGRTFTLLHKARKSLSKEPDKADAGYLLTYFG
jgi:hypothetical protein